MKKVLFTATVDSHILQFHLPFLKLFKEKGYEVHVATNGTEEIPYCDVKHVVSFERSPFKLNNLKAIKQLRKICNKEKFDIIHTHTPMGSVVTRLAALNARKKYNTRVIYTAHGFHFFKGAPLKNWLIFYSVEKWLAKYTDTLILINQEDYNLAKNKFSKRCKDIQYVPGVGIDEEKFNFKFTKKDKEELRKSLGLKKDDFVMIYPAELNENKNQLMIINAMEELSKKYENIKVLLPGVDSYNGYYQQLVKEKNLEDKIFFLGYRKDIPKLLKISDIALATSHREGLPLNVMEAMYVGLPIIATDCRGQRDLVKDHINGYLVSIGDQNRFSECIEKLYLSNGSNNRFGEQSQYVIKEYLLEKILMKLENIYFKKKTVLHILSSNKYSGAENVALSIINNLNSDYNMYYCCPDGDIKDVLLSQKVKFILTKNNSIFELRRVIKNLNPDVVHAHDYRAGFLCSLLKIKNKLIIHLHNNSPWIKKISAYSVVFLLSTLRADKVLIVSPSIEKEYVFSKYIKDKMLCIGNPVSVEKVLSNVNNRKGKNKSFDICCVARLSEQKNPLKFLDVVQIVCKKFENLRVIWVGDGEMKDVVLKEIHDRGLNKNVELVGFKKNPYELMSQSKIFLLTSIFEGYGLVAFEAMALGLPCVVSNVGGLPSVVDDDCGFLCNNTEEYVKAVITLLENSKVRRGYEKKAFLKASKLDNLDEYMKKLSEIYKF